MRNRKAKLAAVAVAGLMFAAGCSGGGGDEPPNAGRFVPSEQPADDGTSTSGGDYSDGGDGETPGGETADTTTSTTVSIHDDAEPGGPVEDEIVDDSLYRFPQGRDLAEATAFFEASRDGLDYPEYWEMLWRFTTDSSRERDALLRYMNEASDLPAERASQVFDRAVGYLRAHYLNEGWENYPAEYAWYEDNGISPTRKAGEVEVLGGGAATPNQTEAEWDGRPVVEAVISFRLLDEEGRWQDYSTKFYGVYMNPETLEVYGFWPRQPG